MITEKGTSLEINVLLQIGW